MGTATPPVHDDAAGLETKRWGLRFVRPDVDREYIAWQRARTMPFNRAAIYAALASLFGGVVTLSWLHPSPTWFVAIAGLAVLTAVLLPITRRPSAWAHRLIALTNALFGVLIVAIYSIQLGMLELSGGGAVLTCFFAFAVNRIRPWQAAGAVFIYFSFQEVLLHRSLAEGRMRLDMFLFETVLLATAFIAGLMTAFVIDADARSSFRQERIIESQAKTIARERARSEELLKRELSHQVAERSRELGAVLARSDVVLDVRRLSTGERFAERYRIVSALGAGGMGAVYEVERMTDSERLALKAVVGEVSGASAARFAREAEIGARVRHENLVSIVDVGVSAGVPFLVMELIRGGALEGQRARFGDVAWALPILRQIAAGVAALHDAGIVHRDLKPANVLLAGDAPSPVAKISDFGISRFGALDTSSSIDPAAPTMAAGAPPRAGLVTGTGVILGTPLYMAPEAAHGGHALDSAADVFAFGIIAYEMLTGRAPFSVPAFVLALAEQPTPAVAPIVDARVPTTLVALVRDCLAGDPSKRPRIRALLSALTPTASGHAAVGR